MSCFFLRRLDSLPGFDPSQWGVDPRKSHEDAGNLPESFLRRILWCWPAVLLLLPALLSAQPSGALRSFDPGGLLLLPEPQQARELALDQDPDSAPEQTAEAATQQGQESPSGGLPGTTSRETTVRGIVRNLVTGQPLPRVLVRIEGDASSGALTDGEGRFEIPGVPLGPQTIRLLKPGFHDRPYATEEVGYQADGPAHNVLVAAEMPDLDFALAPTCAIYGHVELSTGDPAQAITVALAKQVVRNGRAVWALDGTTKTNGEGAYRFASLPDGVYVVYTQPVLESEPAVSVVAAGSAADIARAGYPSVFYPDARDFASASRIRLSAGEQAQANLSLTLEPFQTVTATAILPNGRPFGERAGPGSAEGNLSPPPPIVVTVLDGAGRASQYTAQYDSGTHTIQASLPDGTYTLRAAAASGEWHAPGMGFSASEAALRTVLVTGFAEFSVDGHAVANLRIPLSPPSAWQIHLRALRTAARPAQSTTPATRGLESAVTVTAVRVDAPMENGTGLTAEEAGPDLLHLTDGGLGPVWIGVQVNDRSLCVGSFTAGGANLAREPLNAGLSAAPPPMELTLRDDCAKLVLELPPALSQFLPGDEPFYTVYVVPDFDTTADIPPMTVHPSSGVTLTLDGLTPGDYHVYLFDTPVRLEYRNPSAIAALPRPGQTVTLSPGATSNLVLEAPGR
jgi:hypothetical protein